MTIKNIWSLFIIELSGIDKKKADHCETNILLVSLGIQHKKKIPKDEIVFKITIICKA